jgi:hypothetical protein
VLAKAGTGGFNRAVSLVIEMGSAAFGNMHPRTCLRALTIIQDQHNLDMCLEVGVLLDACYECFGLEGPYDDGSVLCRNTRECRNGPRMLLTLNHGHRYQINSTRTAT